MQVLGLICSCSQYSESKIELKVKNVVQPFLSVRSYFCPFLLVILRTGGNREREEDLSRRYKYYDEYIRT